MPGSAICEVTGTLCAIDGTPKEGAQIRATVKSTQDDQGGQVADGAGITSEMVSAITQEDGTFSIDLIQGARVKLEIPDINLTKEVVIPFASTADFVTLI